ncbi:MAG: nitrous oxide reductase accessory protein NosL [Candidatus Dadabacteria bacterium]|nr:nitrous oxide reductase accessory protein NosL [Candidatus Dadabacteria bacterium]
MRIVFFFLFLLLASCGENNISGPVEIRYGQDMCERCKMIISEERFSAQLILNSRNIYKFDDIGEMILYASESKISPETSEMYVKDFDTGKWLASDEAIYVTVENIKTPMDFGIVALSDKKSADETASEYGGKVIGKFADAQRLLENGGRSRR